MTDIGYRFSGDYIDKNIGNRISGEFSDQKNFMNDDNFDKETIGKNKFWLLWLIKRPI